MARAGERYLKYPWGDAPPDGHTCWKHNGTCAVKSFPAGAFGLFDISGRKIMAWYRRRNPVAVSNYPLPALNPGIYLLIVETAERKELHKIVVE